MGGERYTLKKNTKALVDASKEVGLEASADKTKYMVMSRDQNAGRCHNIKTDNSSYESQYYIRNQQDATLAVSFISHCKITLHVSSGVLKTAVAAVTTDLGHPYWIYSIPIHEQWLLLQFLVLLITCRVILQ
jgi:hypothetical protein